MTKLVTVEFICDDEDAQEAMNYVVDAIRDYDTVDGIYLCNYDFVDVT